MRDCSGRCGVATDLVARQALGGHGEHVKQVAVTLGGWQ